MKKSYKKFILVFLIVLLLMILKDRDFLDGGYEISSIWIKDGSVGEVFKIEDERDIDYIIKKIRVQKFKKIGICIFNMGYLYKMDFFDENGKMVESFILNSDDTIRKDPFLYEAKPKMDGICDYIKNIEEKNGG